MAKQKTNETTWINDGPTTVILPLRDGHRDDTYEIKPKNSEKIPSMYDNAIHTMNKEGTLVIGGLAPMLKRENQNYKVSDALDTNKATLKEESEKPVSTAELVDLIAKIVTSKKA